MKDVIDYGKYNVEELFNPELRTNIEKFIGNLDVEMWVGDTDNIIRQIKATLVSVLPEEQRTAEIGQAQIEISMNINNINETIEVAVPQSTISISDVQALFIDKDTDEDGLTDTEEATYGTEIDNPDTDGDGYSDGSEVENGYNPAGEGELPITIELDTTSMFDTLAPTPEEKKGVCEIYGGKWMVVPIISEESCAAITDFDECSDYEGCKWEYALSSDSVSSCVPSEDYCFMGDF